MQQNVGRIFERQQIDRIFVWNSRQQICWSASIWQNFRWISNFWNTGLQNEWLGFTEFVHEMGEWMNIWHKCRRNLWRNLSIDFSCLTWWIFWGAIYRSISRIWWAFLAEFLAEFSFIFSGCSKMNESHMVSRIIGGSGSWTSPEPATFWQGFRTDYWTFWHFSSPLFNLNFDFDLNQFPSLWKIVANLRVHNSSFLEAQQLSSLKN